MEYKNKVLGKYYPNLIMISVKVIVIAQFYFLKIIYDGFVACN